MPDPRREIAALPNKTVQTLNPSRKEFFLRKPETETEHSCDAAPKAHGIHSLREQRPSPRSSTNDDVAVREFSSAFPASMIPPMKWARKDPDSSYREA